MIYRERDFTTSLPSPSSWAVGTDYVLNNTELKATENLLKGINIFENQVFINCLSDAGEMMYQGLMATTSPRGTR